jgi:hypothetical protein
MEKSMEGVWTCGVEEGNDLVKKCTKLEVEGRRRARGRASKTWKDVIVDDMRSYYLLPNNTLNQSLWKWKTNPWCEKTNPVNPRKTSTEKAKGLWLNTDSFIH